jgi:hypothetical protein
MVFLYLDSNMWIHNDPTEWRIFAYLSGGGPSYLLAIAVLEFQLQDSQPASCIQKTHKILSTSIFKIRILDPIRCQLDLQ